MYHNFVIIDDSPMSMQNLLQNYVFHALLIVWLKALHIANFLESKFCKCSSVGEFLIFGQMVL